MYIDKLQDTSLQPANIRLFCLGKELRDDFHLYSYDIIDEMAIQAMFKKWTPFVKSSTTHPLNAKYSHIYN